MFKKIIDFLFNLKPKYYHHHWWLKRGRRLLLVLLLFPLIAKAESTCEMLYQKTYAGKIDGIQYTIEFVPEYNNLCRGTAYLEWKEVIEYEGVEFYRLQKMDFYFVSDTFDRTARLYPVYMQSGAVYTRDNTKVYTEDDDYIRIFVLSGGIIPYDRTLPVLKEKK